MLYVVVAVEAQKGPEGTQLRVADVSGPFTGPNGLDTLAGVLEHAAGIVRGAQTRQASPAPSKVERRVRGHTPDE